MHRPLSKLMTLGIIASLFAPGCSAASETPSDIDAALGRENGGYTETDELAVFGHDPASDRALTEDLAIDDATAHTAAVTELIDSPGAATYQVQLRWGQFPVVADGRPVDWSGRLSVNRGAIIVMRATQEGLYDHLTPRADASALSLRSVTGQDPDGLLVRIVDPDPDASAPLTLAYDRSGSPTGTPQVMTVSDLAASPDVVFADGSGNRMVAAAMLSGVCPRGFLSGRWGVVSGASGGEPASGASPASGIMRGRVTDPTGAIIGHVEGIWGTQPGPLGARVFFAKYINQRGNFVGILRGTAANGVFDGEWMSMGTAIGTVRGRYHAATSPSGGPSTAPSGGPSVGGHFLGLVAGC